MEKELFIKEFNNNIYHSHYIITFKPKIKYEFEICLISNKYLNKITLNLFNIINISFFKGKNSMLDSIIFSILFIHFSYYKANRKLI